MLFSLYIHDCVVKFAPTPNTSLLMPPLWWVRSGTMMAQEGDGELSDMLSVCILFTQCQQKEGTSIRFQEAWWDPWPNQQQSGNG